MTNKTNYIEEGNIPVLACTKACTEGFVLDLQTVAESAKNESEKAVPKPTRRTPDGAQAFGPTISVKNSTIVFCATYKMVSCKWQAAVKGSGASQAEEAAGEGASGTWETWWGPRPTNTLGGKYLCNQRKHATLVGVQLHGDEFKQYDNTKTFYALDNSVARPIVEGWGADDMFNTSRASVDRTAFPDVEPFLQIGQPADVQGKNFYDFIEAQKDALCMKHLLLA